MNNKLIYKNILLYTYNEQAFTQAITEQKQNINFEDVKNNLFAMLNIIDDYQQKIETEKQINNYNQDVMLTVSEVANVMHLTKQNVNYHITTKKLNAVSINAKNEYRIKLDDVISYCNQSKKYRHYASKFADTFAYKKKALSF